MNRLLATNLEEEDLRVLTAVGFASAASYLFFILWRRYLINERLIPPPLPPGPPPTGEGWSTVEEAPDWYTEQMKETQKWIDEWKKIQDYYAQHPEEKEQMEKYLEEMAKQGDTGPGPEVDTSQIPDEYKGSDTAPWVNQPIPFGDL